MAGHSKWANIKHKKARVDAKRGKAWSKCSKAIMVAVKMGGPSPDANLSLRYAIDEAKAVNMPKDTIENAIKKASGDQDGANYESIVYEGYGPAGVAMMLDILTDNRNRTAAEIRKTFEKANGNMGATGCVSYLFQNKGQLFIEKGKASEEQLMEVALENGGEDIQEEDEVWQVVCEPGDYIPLKEAIQAAGIEIASSELTMIPDNTVAVAGDDARKVQNLIDNLEDHDDVQKVYTNAELPDEELAGA